MLLFIFPLFATDNSCLLVVVFYLATRVVFVFSLGGVPTPHQKDSPDGGGGGVGGGSVPRTSHGGHVLKGARENRSRRAVGYSQSLGHSVLVVRLVLFQRSVHKRHCRLFQDGGAGDGDDGRSRRGGWGRERSHPQLVGKAERKRLGPHERSRGPFDAPPERRVGRSRGRHGQLRDGEGGRGGAHRRRVRGPLRVRRALVRPLRDRRRRVGKRMIFGALSNTERYTLYSLDHS
mmetsp:Transcript_27209/g.46234  ORF Transcript_27209/g.46234 Transcript_27209/m.46234 type:complete len:233 (+) Transcript_27209:647-1345(+)